MAISGGSELNAVRTVEQLLRRGIAPVVFTLRDEGGMRKRYEAAGVDVVAFPLKSLLGASALVAARRMAAEIRARRIDVVHAHDSYSNLIATIAARLAGVPCIASKRWTQNPQRRHLWTNRIAYRLATRILANSEAVGDTVMRDEWVPRSRILVVTNFVDDELLVPLETAVRDSRRADFGFSDGEVVICCVARLRAEKDHASLIRAFGGVAGEFPTARLLLVGDGPEETALRALTDAYGITARVVFAGHRGNASRLHQVADISVLTSLHEGFPNTIVEAMAAGRPVVATAVGGVLDAVVPEVTGLLVAPGDVESLRKALSRLVADSDLRAQFGAAGRARAISTFAADAVIGELVQAYNNISAKAA